MRADDLDDLITATLADVAREDREARVDWYAAVIAGDREARNTASWVLTLRDPNGRVLAAVALDDAEEPTEPSAWDTYASCTGGA